MKTLSDTVSDYCGSEHFMFLEPQLKEHAEGLLLHWCEIVDQDGSEECVYHALREVRRLDVPAEVKQQFPVTLDAFLEFAAATGLVPGVEQLQAQVSTLSDAHRDSIREDGSVKGETVRQSMKPPGRNTPCPCGSGKKYKRCCSPLYG